MLPTEPPNLSEQAGSAPARIAWSTAAFFAVVMTIFWLVTEDSSVVGAVMSSVLCAVIFGFGMHRWLIWRETEG